MPNNLNATIRRVIALQTISENESESEEEVTMTEMATPDFLRVCAQTINKNFTGEPLALTPFIRSIKLLQALATTDTLRGILLNFVLSRLEGKALEAVPVEPENVQTIIDNLKLKIKPDNSKVVEGRLLALNANKKSLQDFSKEAEGLSDAFKRALIIEGVSEEKANEMTVDRTIEMCRSSAKTDLLKSVISSTKYDSAKEVLAKFVVEINSEQKDKQVLSFRTQRNFQFQNRGNQSNYRNNSQRNQNFGNNRYRNNQFNNNRPNNYSNNRQFQNNQNPNGQWSNQTGQFRNNNFNRRNNFNNRQNNNSNNQNSRNVRYTYPENSAVPQRTLGALNAENQLEM